MECRSLCAGCPGVFPSSWILGVPLFAGGSVPLGFLLASRTLAGHALLSFSGCGSCRPAEFRFGLRHVGVFASSCLWHFWPHLFAWFLLVFCHWLHAFPMCWVLGIFSSSCVFGRAFVRWWPCPRLAFLLVSRALNKRPKDSAAPLLAAAVRRLLPALRLLPAS